MTHINMTHTINVVFTYLRLCRRGEANVWCKLLVSIMMLCVSFALTLVLRLEVKKSPQLSF